ncbi:hypothetical protein CIPAW_16G063000 [Carya illinoinensis]|uniref:Uncharacterized protein n=1 Tax=Carya illinoinensis TaxID=32201 RepID=A0A8T1N7E7_CARIL|nr:hypothetical protein CIPAW_16G063000 [Carya illinoinensis]
MSVINVLLGIISHINSLLASFWWGEVEGKRKVRWCSWGKVCKPTSEGGLGVRDIKDVQKSLHMKLAFRLLTSNNLWADLFRAKYCRNDHVLAQKERPTNSRFWRSMMAIIPEVMENVKISVRGGNSSFWFDKWLASGPLSVNTEVITNKKLCIQDC